tara:strand:+ start:1312 stop:1650 length:339 start_codon:yes stop_codon:yes gene_type:complete
MPHTNIENNKEYHKKYWIENKDRLKNYQKYWWLTKRYNLTKDQYNKMLSDQNYNCKVCNIKMIKPHVDHCHKTNKVRGLLCNGCNTGLGLLKEDINIMEKLIKYVKEHNGQK